jgi:8-oxo-dGTP pyrophosphatase MutT (NUDIX family)
MAARLVPSGNCWSAVLDNFLVNDIGLQPSDAVVGLVVVPGGRYLMQLRSQKAGIFYPDHWGLFGGAVDPGEGADEALRRELQEELGVAVPEASYFTEFSFDFGFRGLGRVWRRYYLIEMGSQLLEKVVLGEGSDMRAFEARDILSRPRIVPYDAFAIWLHATRR